MSDIKRGDTVRVVSSPYLSVPVGTVAVVGQVKLNHFGPRQHLYLLPLRNTAFRAHELAHAAPP